MKDFTPTLYKLIFFLLVSVICHYAIACRKTEKILRKTKGAYWRRPIQGKRVLKRQENLDLIRKKVVQKLFEETCCSTSGSPANTLARPSLSQEIVTIVENFYEQDNISRQAPSKRDKIVVRSNVRKETSQGTHLFMTAAEAYKLFREKDPGKCIGNSKLLNYHLTMYFYLVIYQSMFALAGTINISCCSGKQCTKFRVTFICTVTTCHHL